MEGLLLETWERMEGRSRYRLHGLALTSEFSSSLRSCIVEPSSPCNSGTHRTSSTVSSPSSSSAGRSSSGAAHV